MATLPLTADDGEARLGTSSTEKIKQSGADVIQYPEGGPQAWQVVFGSFLAMFSTWGIINSYVGITFPMTSSC